jgi:hypothetical protein
MAIWFNRYRLQLHATSARHLFRRPAVSLRIGTSRLSFWGEYTGLKHLGPIPDALYGLVNGCGSR